MLELDARLRLKGILAAAPFDRSSSPNIDKPLAFADFRMTARTRKSEPRGRSRGRVLVIADEDQSRLIQTLDRRGIEVVGVSTGAAAMVSLQRGRPHLVVANTSTRGLRVDELSRILAQTEDGIPLILVGPEVSTVAVRHAAMLDGAFDYFELPSEFELLVERSQQLITLRQKVDRLRADADLDALTNLANRRRFREALEREVERFRRYGVPCAMLLIDIDHLKAINDKFGHPAGDMVIRQVAQTLSQTSRDNDTAARLGGEEFAILLSGVEVEKAAAAAERLRIVLAATAVEGVGHITVSIGVAGCPQSSCTERDLYAASDSALYVAKNAGRNRVAIAPALQEQLPGVEA